jgi:hypothetical protein
LFRVRHFFRQYGTPPAIFQLFFRLSLILSASGLFVWLGIATTLHRDPIAKLAMQYNLPSVCMFRDYVQSGGLVPLRNTAIHRGADVGRQRATIIQAPQRRAP